MRAMVVGASSGLGRCVGTGLAKNGHQVAMVGRRQDRVESAAEEGGNGAIAVPCDATDAAQCADAVSKVVAAFGGIDALVYTPGVGPLRRIAEIDSETWHSAFDTNVVGAALMTAAALPHLLEAKGSAAYFSSISASLTPPWPGLAAYAVTKAALDKLIEAWRAEHPGVGFTRVVVGDTPGGEGHGMTEFASGWDPELAGEFAGGWFQRGYLAGNLLDVNELTRVVESVLRTDGITSVPSVIVTPRSLT